MRTETDPTCITTAAKLIATLSVEETVSGHPLLSRDYHVDLVGVRSRFHQLAGVQAALFPLEALMLSGTLKVADDDEDTHESV